MHPPLQVKLSESEDITLEQLSLANAIAKRTKQRAMALRLSHQGWSVTQIGDYLKCTPQTVRKTIHRWETQGLMGLWDNPRSGRKRSWDEEDWQYLEKCLNEECGYTSKQLAEKLEPERQVKLGAEQIRRILKKKLALEENKKATPFKPESQRSGSQKARFGNAEEVGRNGFNHLNVFRRVRMLSSKSVGL